MKNFIETVKNIWRIEELRNRILITLGLLLVFRIGSFIALPGVDSTRLSSGTGAGSGRPPFTKAACPAGEQGQGGFHSPPRWRAPPEIAPGLRHQQPVGTASRH